MAAASNKFGPIFQKFQLHRTLKSWNNLRFSIGYNESGKPYWHLSSHNTTLQLANMVRFFVNEMFMQYNPPCRLQLRVGLGGIIYMLDNPVVELYTFIYVFSFF